MLRTLFALLTVLILASDVFAAAPKLTLLFSGNTEAEVRPCPS